MRGWVAAGAVDDWLNQRAASKGAALAFYTLFSMAPLLLLLVIAIAGTLFGVDAAHGEIYHQLKGLLGSSGAELVQYLVANARSPASSMKATFIAVVLLVIGATTVFAELKDSLDEIWQVPRARQVGLRGFFRTRLVSFGLILVLVFLLLIALITSAVLALLEQFVGGLWAQAAFVFGPVALLMFFGVIACLFAVIYRCCPVSGSHGVMSG